MRIVDKELLSNHLRKANTDELRRELASLSIEDLERPLALVDVDVLKKLDELEQKFPNFSDVVGRYRRALKLQKRKKLPLIKLPQLLLIGPPGVGKTRFLTELGKVLNTGFFSVDMSTVTAGFVMSGMSSQWGNAKPGFVTTSLRESQVANPLILVDEIDKASDDSRYSATSCFFSLLEKHSAEHFKDEFLGVPMDCSYINWVASANYEEKIEPAIRSRMVVVHIKEPTPEQTFGIVKSIYAEMHVENEWKGIFKASLPKTIIDMLIGLPPRVIRKVLEDSCHRAFERCENKKGSISLVCNDVVLPQIESKRPMGFY